jgi:hypothetical protein
MSSYFGKTAKQEEGSGTMTVIPKAKEAEVPVETATAFSFF